MTRTKEIPQKKPHGAKTSIVGSIVAKMTKKKMAPVTESDSEADEIQGKIVDDKTKEKGKKEKKKRRFKSGTVATREIKKAQKHGNKGFAVSSTNKLIIQIASEFGLDVNRFEKKAMNAIRVAAEQFETEFMRLGHILTVHRGKKTLQVEDVNLAGTLMLAPHILHEEQGSLKATKGLMFSKKNATKYSAAADPPATQDEKMMEAELEAAKATADKDGDDKDADDKKQVVTDDEDVSDDEE